MSAEGIDFSDISVTEKTMETEEMHKDVRRFVDLPLGTRFVGLMDIGTNPVVWVVLETRGHGKIVRWSGTHNTYANPVCSATDTVLGCVKLMVEVVG